VKRNGQKILTNKELLQSITLINTSILKQKSLATNGRYSILLQKRDMNLKFHIKENVMKTYA
jgi:hypothetical protein